MDNLGTLLIFAAITAFSFFVTAPIMLNAISTFTVEKRFTRDMIKKRIISESDISEIQPQKQVAGIIISIIVLTASIYTAIRFKPFGLICFAFGLILGLLKYRNILSFSNLTVKRFQNNYQGKYDANKLNEYIKKTF